MTEALKAIRRLRRVADALARNEAPDAADCGWFVAAVNSYQARCRTGEAGSLDRELGLLRHGSNGWWTAEVLERRNEAIRALRDRHFAHLSDGQAARYISALAHNYGGTRSRQRRAVDPDSIDAMLRAALCETSGFPKPKQLKTILGSRTPLSGFRNDASANRL